MVAFVLGGPSSNLSIDANEIAWNTREQRAHDFFLPAGCGDADKVDDISPNDTEKARNMAIREPCLVKSDRRTFGPTVLDLLLQLACFRVQCVVHTCIWSVPCAASPVDTRQPAVGPVSVISVGERTAVSN